jgi:hypothetical protein
MPDQIILWVNIIDEKEGKMVTRYKLKADCMLAGVSLKLPVDFG